MKKLRVYLDTSVINFLFADDAPEFKKITVAFFEQFVKPETYLVYVSDVVIKEIQKTSDERHRNELLRVISDYNLRIVTLNEEADQLAQTYIQRRIIPAYKLEDAEHIAIATVQQMDILLSWNFKHLANIKQQRAVQAINEQANYWHPLALLNPMEVMYEDEENSEE